MFGPKVGHAVLYRVDGRGGIAYDVPAIVTCTRDSHPKNKDNPIPVPDTVDHVHLHVMTPGPAVQYQEFNVPITNDRYNPEPRSWRWID